MIISIIFVIIKTVFAVVVNTYDAVLIIIDTHMYVAYIMLVWSAILNCEREEYVGIHIHLKPNFILAKHA